MDFLDTSIESLIPVDKNYFVDFPVDKTSLNFLRILKTYRSQTANIPAEKIDASVLSKDIGLQYSTVQYNTLQYSAVQYSTVQFNMETTSNDSLMKFLREFKSAMEEKMVENKDNIEEKFEKTNKKN